mmetsp:Transcript_13111/g.29138  ORF Transcript_13111/g.29138 Transcript_13111/m.29138 type:complete len:263 (-) Transcript_13111:340-1128(-)
MRLFAMSVVLAVFVGFAFCSLCHSRSAAVVLFRGILPRQLLFQRFLRHQVFVGLALVPVVGGLFPEPNKTKHAQNIVPESHEKGPDAEKGSAAGLLGLDGLDLQNQLAVLEGVGGDGFDARTDPLAVHHALAGTAFSLAASVLDELSGLGRNVADGLAGPGHAGAGFVSLFEDDGDGSLEADPLVAQGRCVTGGIGEGFLLDPFRNVRLFAAALLLGSGRRQGRCGRCGRRRKERGVPSRCSQTKGGRKRGGRGCKARNCDP